MGLASRLVGFVLLLLIFLAGPGCYNSHELDGASLGVDASMSDIGLRDASLLEDGAVVDASVMDGGTIRDAGTVSDTGVIRNDAGLMTPCVREFEVQTLRIATLDSGWGFDLDGGGTQVGCGVDGVDGVDNGLASLVAYATTQGVNLDQLLLAAITLGRIDARFRLNTCRSDATLAWMENGAVVGRSRPAVVGTDGSGGLTFRGSVEQVPIRFGGRNFVIDFTMDQAQVSGTITGTTVSPLVIGGAVSRERIEAFAVELARVADVSLDDVESALLDLLDLPIDEGAGTCEDLSAAFHGTGRVYVVR
jgi:hypothetical protein